MSEKITFQELIESIAEETDNSKQFTQDFIKDFVEVINEGLEDDGNVNIAGFGKFDLRRVDEREGFNPQTEERITIPAHNKLVFKPYKNLREVVNAPYAHQEPKLIKEEEDETLEEGSTDSQTSDHSKYMPGGTTTSEESSGETTEETDSEEVPFDFDDAEEEKEQEKEAETASPADPFAFDSKETSDEDEDEDIIEFKANENAGEEGEDVIDEELKKFLGGSDQPEEDYRYKPSQENSGDDSLEQSEEPFEKSDDILSSVNNEDEAKAKEKNGASLSLNQHRRTQERAATGPIVMVAAAFILLLAAGGVWYFALLPDGNMQEMESQQMITAVDHNTAENNQQDEPADNRQEQDPQQTADNDQNQSPDAGSSSSATASASAGAQTERNKNEEINIEKGQTLWSLAEEQYGNPRLWPWIYGNNGSVKNPDLIFAGSSLSVPLPSGPDNRLNSADSVGVAKGYIATYRWYKDNDSSKAKNHLLGAKVYHDDISNIADVKIDKADLSYANTAR